MHFSLDSKVVKPVNPKGNQSWIFIGRTDAEAPIFWPLEVKGLLTGKDPDAGKEEGVEGITEDEIVGWQHRLNEQEFEQIPGGCKGQGSRVCHSPWGCKSQTWLRNWKTMGFLGGSVVKKKKKNLPAIKVAAEDMGSIPGWGRSLEKDTTHSNILAWRILQQRRLAGYCP